MNITRAIIQGTQFQVLSFKDFIPRNSVQGSHTKKFSTRIPFQGIQYKDPIPRNSVQGSHTKEFSTSVSEHLGWVRNVILIKCIFGSGKPWGVEISGKGPHGLNEGTEGQFTSNRETRWTDPVTARRVPSK
jgi:hypothetical protein